MKTLRSRESCFLCIWLILSPCLNLLSLLHLHRSQICLSQSWLFTVSPIWAHNNDWIQSPCSKYKSSGKETWICQLESCTDLWPNHWWQGRGQTPMVHYPLIRSWERFQRRGMGHHENYWQAMIVPSPWLPVSTLPGTPNHNYRF